MANISITTACNRDCSYCFARSPAPRNMTIPEFERSLDFVQRSGMDQVRLLGGEPTLHPDFPRFVDSVLSRGLRLLIFSNGLMPEPAVRCLESAPADRAAVLINVAVPGECRPEEDLGQRSTLRRLGRRATLGLNIYAPTVRPDFLLGLIRDLGLSPCIRLGLAHCRVDQTNRFLHPRYYRVVGQGLAGFAGAARAEGVALEFDCGFVPCMFPPGFLDTAGITASDIGLRCSPLLDVLPDSRVVCCYPLASLHCEPIPEHHDAAWMRNRFEVRFSWLRPAGIFRECAGCGLRASGQCAGGCLAAAMGRLRRAPFAVSLPNG